MFFAGISLVVLGLLGIVMLMFIGAITWISGYEKFKLYKTLPYALFVTLAGIVMTIVGGDSL